MSSNQSNLKEKISKFSHDLKNSITVINIIEEILKGLKRLTP